MTTARAIRRTTAAVALALALLVGATAPPSAAGTYNCPSSTKILYNQYYFPVGLTVQYVTTAPTITSIGSTVEMLGGAGYQTDTYSYSWFASGGLYYFYLDYQKQAAAGNGLFIIQYCV